MNYRFYKIIFLYFVAFMPSVFAQSVSPQTLRGRDVTKNVRVEAIVGREVEYHYLSMSKPNPFIPPMISSLVTSLELPIENSLQNYPLSDMKVIGIWTLRTGERKALVLMPNTEAVTIVKGTLIGRRGGLVTSIDENSLTVREFSLSSDGTKQYEDINLWLEEPKPEPEKTIFMHSDKLSDPLAKGYGSKNYLNLEDHETKRKELIKDSDNLNVDIPLKDESKKNFPTLMEKSKKEPVKEPVKESVIDSKSADLVKSLGSEKENVLKNVKPSTGD